jgi:hypothetical protein
VLRWFFGGGFFLVVLGVSVVWCATHSSIKNGAYGLVTLSGMDFCRFFLGVSVSSLKFQDGSTRSRRRAKPNQGLNN